MTRRDAYLADRGMPGHWFLMCPTCPMHAEKVRESDSPARIACMGGRGDAETPLRVVNTCWHTDAQDVSLGERGFSVGCRFDPERDLWNHPGGMVGAPKEPQTIVAERKAGESVGDALRQVQQGALLGTLHLPRGYRPAIKRGE